MLKTTIAIMLAATMTACVTAKIEQSFNAADGAYIHKSGTGKIEGSAFLRQRGGGTVTAAGNEIILTPVTPYSSARFAVIYKGNKQTYLGTKIEDTPEEYITQSKKIKADVEGRFKFDGLHPGDYFLSTHVYWQVPGSYLPEGALISERVTVRNGETTNVVMSGS